MFLWIISQIYSNVIFLQNCSIRETGFFKTDLVVLRLCFRLLIIEFHVWWQIGKIVLKTEIEGIFSYSCDVREASILSEPPPCPPLSKTDIVSVQSTEEYDYWPWTIFWGKWKNLFIDLKCKIIYETNLIDSFLFIISFKILTQIT